MKTFNSIKIVLVALFAVAALHAPAHARASQTSSGSFSIPKAGNGDAGKLNQYGVAQSTENAAGEQDPNSEGGWLAAQCKTWSTQAGKLYGIELSSGTAVTEYVACFDATDCPTLTADINTVTAANFVSIGHRSATVESYKDYSDAPRTFKAGLSCHADSARFYIPLFREDR